jgi:hypothetical protein
MQSIEMITSITFRFDIDTIKCIEVGVPKLINLAIEKRVRFLFFINAGRSIHRFYSIFKKNKIIKNPNQMPVIQKLGIFYVFKSLIFNKKMYKYSREIQDIVKFGQVLGIHGGKNHKTWEKNGSLWNYEKIFTEIKWAQDKIKKVVPNVDLINFSSPAWQTSADVISACEKLGFKNVYDSRNGKNIETNNKKIRIINTELCEPFNGIGYLEFLITKGYEHQIIVNEIINQLKIKEGKVVLYDHPVIAGVQGIEILSSVIDWCQDNGVEVNVDE